jgi:hypothetical protein
MSRILFILLFAGMAAGYVRAADTNTPARAETNAPARVTFYLQLIRGNSESTPPAPGAKLIGPKLSQRLLPVFKWSNYWEIKRDSVDLEVGKSVRKKLSPEREVEVELLKTQEIAVRVIRNNKPPHETRQAAANALVICGGDKDEDQSWFIVVRRDNPSQP